MKLTHVLAQHCSQGPHTQKGYITLSYSELLTWVALTWYPPQAVDPSPL